MKIRLFSFSILLLLFITACSSKTDEEYFNSGKQAVEEENYNEALVEFESIINEYPEGKYAERAYFEIGKLYHAKKIKSVTEKESLKKAVEYYNKMHELYPDSPNSPNAMFMVGFIYANDLKDYDAAKKAYTDFMEKYPESELVFSAREELNNIGLDAEEILRKKLDSAK